MAAGPTVYIVDDEAGVRKALSVVLKSAGHAVRSFASAEACIAAIEEGPVGCLLVDLRLRGMSGIELLAKLREMRLGIPTLVMSGHGDVPAAVASMKLGAVDFLEKPLDHNVLLARVAEALARSHAGHTTLAPPDRGRDRLATLSRELEILRLLIGGRSSKQIALDTGLSLKTVSNHRAHLLAKTGAENTADLVRIAVVAGITKPPADAP